MDTVFARTRYEYSSYADFWRVVELSGFTIVYVDEIDVHDKNKTYIVTPLNGEWNNGWANASARIILYDLEWRNAAPVIPGISEIWAADQWYCQSRKMKYVMLGSHSDLCPVDIKIFTKEYDVVMFAYMVWRRDQMRKRIEGEGLHFAPPEIDRMGLAQSRLMVHIHQHEGLRTVAPTRWMACAAYHLPMLSEKVEDPGLFAHTCLWADYNFIPGFAKLVLSDKWARDLRGYADILHDQLCERYTFRKCIEAAL